MLQRWKNLLGVFVAAVALSFAAFGAGVGVAEFASPPQLEAQGPPLCEDDECELGTACVNNEGGGTHCDMSPGPSCKTFGC